MPSKSLVEFGRCDNGTLQEVCMHPPMPVEKGSLLRKEGGLGSILGHCIVGRIYLKLFPSTSSSKPRLTLLLLSTSFAHGVLFAGRSCLCCVSLTSIVHFNGGK